MGMMLATSPLPNVWTSYDLLMKTGRATCAVVARWTMLNGDVNEVSEIGFLEDMDSIRERVWVSARKEGWTPKRWWKFWRWDDTPNPASTPPATPAK